MSKVYFVGCGPGDPELITIKAKKLIQKADVLVYSGSLIPSEIVKLCKKGKKHDAAKLVREEIFGLLLKKVSIAKFSRTLSTLIKSGVSILVALEIVAKTAGNKVIERSLVITRAAISEGRTLAEPLQESKIFPGMVVQMVGVGEQTGAMDTMLAKIADF